ncbi:hypothetical protein HMI54_014079 [Coelomomyces lativittatus]|nr:hypothetical protein HMI54_014079 [Coelomomyces lativittatus]
MKPFTLSTSSTPDYDSRLSNLQPATWVQKLGYHFFAPEYLPGNINIGINGLLFLGTLYGFHRWGRWLAA